MRSVVIGTGSALPKKAVTNADLEKTLDTSDEWIVSRTGIKQRYICGEGESTGTLAIEAARHALGNAGLTADEIDLVIVASITQDMNFPGIAAQIQNELHIKGGPAFDIHNACNGFIQALDIANMYLTQGKAKNALIIGADAMSKLVNWQDRSTAVLFGDGAGAVVLQAQNTTTRGIVGVENFSDGAHMDLLKTEHGPGTTQQTGGILMQGQGVFKNAVRSMGEVVPLMLSKYNLKQEDITYLVPHQANARIIEAIAKMLNLPMSQVVLTVDKQANTSAATIPLALDHAHKQNMFREGDILFMAAFGAGFSWGGAILSW